MIKELQEAMEAALPLWVRLTGVEPETASLYGTMGSVAADLWSLDGHERLSSAFAMDPSGVTGAALLVDLFRDYALGKAVSLWDAVRGTDDDVRTAASLDAILSSPAVTDALDEARETAARALSAYGPLTPEVRETLRSTLVGDLRYRALLSAGTLSVNRFSAGARGGGPMKGSSTVALFGGGPTPCPRSGRPGSGPAPCASWPASPCTPPISPSSSGTGRTCSCSPTGTARSTPCRTR